MGTLQRTEGPRPKGHLLIAAGLVLMGGITTQWLIEEFPDPQRRPRSNITQGELLSAAATSPDAKTIRQDQGIVIEGGGSDYSSVTFDLLGSFYYEPPALEGPDGPAGVPVIKNQIPTPIKTLNKKRVAVQGFMFPITREGDKVKTFLLVKDRSLCCFGRTPRMNDKIYVRMREGRTAQNIMDQVITVFGVLEVGEVFDKNDQLRSIYNMEADNAAPAPGL